jgi:hypothetical protein
VPINAEERIAVFSMVNRRVKETEELLRAVRGTIIKSKEEEIDDHQVLQSCPGSAVL